MSTRPCGSVTPAGGLNKSAFAMVKIAGLAPIPIASEAAAVNANSGLRRSRRAAWRRSWTQESSTDGITRRRAKGSQAAEFFQAIGFEPGDSRNVHATQMLLEVGFLGAPCQLDVEDGRRSRAGEQHSVELIFGAQGLPLFLRNRCGKIGLAVPDRKPPHL